MNSKTVIYILSFLFLSLSVFGKSSTPNLRKAVSTDVEIDTFSLNVQDDKEKRILVSALSSEMNEGAE